MRSRLSFLICLTAAALLLAACSSTTVVARDERATNSGASTGADPDDDPGADGAEQAADADTDTDTADTDGAGDTTDTDGAGDGADDTDDDSRGSRDDTPAPREVDVAEGFGLGGAEQLASLLTDCQDGNDLACDILFQISEFESEEEDAAVTCGGRTDDEGGFCTSGIEAGPDELVFDVDSEGLDRVVEACEVDGNMTACDFLYYRSPLDSEFQEIGSTCGGRVSVAIPDCRSIIDE